MKFLVDQMMGKLCKWLIILGFDAELNRELDLDKVRKRCLEEDRTFITKSVKNFKKVNLSNSLIIMKESSSHQLKVILAYLNFNLNLNLNLNPDLFSRCLECNTPVLKKDKESLKDKVPERSYQYYSDFYECPKCNKIYWKGTHYSNTIKKLEKIIQKD